MYQICCRILGYIVTIVLHVGNATFMSTRFNGEVMNNPHVKHFSEMQIYFFTCWTFTFQITYAAIALYSDILTLKNFKHRSYRLPKILTDGRDTYFVSVVWPSTLLVFIVFWSFFSYDRNLLYPEDIDLAIPPTSNHIMHSWILFIVLWEVVFRERTPRRSHILYLLITLGAEAIYFATVLGVYYFKGAYVYPIFGDLIGTKYFYFFVGLVSAILMIVYYMHWVLNDFLWHTKVKTTNPQTKSSAKKINGYKKTSKNTVNKFK